MKIDSPLAQLEAFDVFSVAQDYRLNIQRFLRHNSGTNKFEPKRSIPLAITEPNSLLLVFDTRKGRNRDVDSQKDDSNLAKMAPISIVVAGLGVESVSLFDY